VSRNSERHDEPAQVEIMMCLEQENEETSRSRSGEIAAALSDRARRYLVPQRETGPSQVVAWDCQYESDPATDREAGA
jgi:hypothetical protein